MPEEVEIPAGIAHTAVVAYEAAVCAQRRELFPNPDGRWNEEAALQRRQWPPEQIAELDRLRQLRDQAFAAMNSHPLTIAAQEAGTWKNIATTLQKELLAQQEAEPDQP